MPNLEPKSMEYSRHARRQMKWRKISEDDIENVVNNPDYFEYSAQGRINAFKKVQGRLLKITYKPEENEIIVITAMVKGM
jgi:acyl-CoA thioesterase FadM